MSSDAGSVWATRCSEYSSVGVGQARQPVQGDRSLPVRLARHPTAVTGDHRDEQQRAAPRRRRADRFRREAVGHERGAGDGEGGRGTDAQGEGEAAGEAGDDDRRDQREDEGRAPSPGDGHQADVQRHLEQDADQAGSVVGVADRPEAAGGGVDGGHEDGADGDGIAGQHLRGRQQDRRRRGGQTERRDDRPEHRHPVEGLADDVADVLLGNAAGIDQSPTQLARHPTADAVISLVVVRKDLRFRLGCDGLGHLVL